MSTITPGSRTRRLRSSKGVLRMYGVTFGGRLDVEPGHVERLVGGGEGPTRVRNHGRAAEVTCGSPVGHAGRGADTPFSALLSFGPERLGGARGGAGLLRERRGATSEHAVIEGVEVSVDHWIGGERVRSGERFADMSPIDEGTIAEVARGGAGGGRTSPSTAAREASATWGGMQPKSSAPPSCTWSRGRRRESRAELAAVETRDNGSLLARCSERRDAARGAELPLLRRPVWSRSRERRRRVRRTRGTTCRGTRRA